MSKLPKPNELPKPKTLSAKDDLNTQAHQAVLDWLWENLEAVVPGVFDDEAQRIGSMAESAVKAYRDAVQGLLLHLEAKSQDAGLPSDLRGAAEEAAVRVRNAYRSAKIPAFPLAAAWPELKTKEYQCDLVKYKQDSYGTVKTEKVGYIDIEALLATLSNVAIVGCPSPVRLGLSELPELALDPPKWRIDKGNRTILWFDVRGTLPLSGVLVRELRGLRDLADVRTLIFVVASDIPPEVASLLSHEGFFTISQKDWPQFPVK